ncbi:DEKNAAC100712 [Brettanomyces naardenensis]|uniref:Dipeptidyl peptidase 3 n=1 Tax=Brettanomyces naardenensis TaxID=13370 RepID=A0A448YGB5_BRENA|nr:DEKNAAC100712 [Brettanomyces naardenensis]
MSVDAKNYYADTGAPIARVEAGKYFKDLTPKEQLYAHYFSKAGHWGTRAVLRSVSPESEDIYDLILTIHRAVKGNYSALEVDLGKEAVQQYLEYASQFLANLGNYKSFGDVKFVPRIPLTDLKSLVELINSESALQLFEDVRIPLYSLDSNISLLGSPEKGHVSGYYLNLVTKAEGEAVDAALAAHGVMPENIRVEKASEGKFVVHVASANISNATGYYPEKIDFTIKGGEPASLTFQFGDHSREFAKVAENLSLAKMHAANETQVKMLENYIASFLTGSMNCHYNSQIYWVKDIGPAVETNVGFIETYRDYLGTKGEWECLVAMVNKDRTKKFGELVNNAKNFISELPWDQSFEKDTFTPPDFTSLEVLTFAGSGCPIGINIPNYDKIRLNVGFKNVSLGNILNAKSRKEPISFISEDIQGVYDEYRTQAFEVQVGIHELLGHGTGKLLLQNDDGSFNFDRENPPVGLDGKPVKTYYKKGETWGSLFGSVAGPYEECRAESVAMFLVTDRKLLKIFGYNTKEEQDRVIYVSYLSMCRAGLLALEFYDPENKKWGQPHCQARYAIMKTYLNAGKGLLEFEYTKKDFSDLTIRIDESRISTVGQDAIGEFLRKLHIYKCSADVVEGTKFFNDLTEIPDDFLKFRDIVLKKKLPRKQLVQANTFVGKDGKVELRDYDETEIGMINSFAERET